MTSPSFSRQVVSAILRQMRLRTVLIVVFVLQVVMIVGLVGYLSFQSGQRAVNDLAAQLRRELSERIARELRGYLDLPQYFAQVNAAALGRGAVDFETQGNIFLFQQEILVTNFLSVIGCVKETGELSSGARFVHPNGTLDASTLVSSMVNAEAQYHLQRYKLDSQGNRTEFIKDFGPYDPHSRPFYQAAVQQGGPAWSFVLDFTTKLPTVSASRPVYHETTGELIGVCYSNTILSTQFRQFLAGLQIGQTGQVFISDRAGAILASSTDEPLTVGEGEDTKLIQATDSSEPLIRETARYLQGQFGDFASIDQESQLDFNLDGERQFVQVLPFHDDRGLDWLIVITVPEADFMGQINANTRNTILLSLAALLVSILVGVLTARWVTTPLLHLNAAAKLVAAGNFDQTADVSRHDEVGELARSFNHMSRQLQQAFKTLQTSERKFRSLYEDSKDTIFIITAAGELVDMNPAGLALFGLNQAELTSFNVGDLYVHLEDRLKFRQEIQAHGAITDFEVKLQKRDGSQFDALISAALRYDQEGAVAGYQGIIHDITAQKQNERLRAERERLETELGVARRLQRMILPTLDELAGIDDLDIAAYMESADEVGGDYYDVLPQNGSVKISIGDVTDHGLESGVIMLMTQMAVRTLLTNGEQDAKRFLTTLNRALYGNAQRMGTSRTLTLSLLDYHYGQLTLSGHHEEVLVVRQGGALERIDTFALGFPIALREHIDDMVDQMTIELKTGDGVVLYTDGITEAPNPAGEEYGLERLCAVISQHWAEPAEAIKHTIIADLQQHIGAQKVYDDITLIVVKRK